MVIPNYTIAVCYGYIQVHYFNMFLLYSSIAYLYAVVIHKNTIASDNEGIHVRVNNSQELKSYTDGH